MGIRTTGRKLAMQAVYQSEIRGCEMADLLPEFIGQTRFQAATKEWAIHLSNGVASHLEEIDELIRKYSKHWSFDRVNRVDKAILRIAFFELLHSDTTPNIVLDEAIEIAKKYSTEDSPKFINGILGKFVEDQCSPA